MHSTRNSSSSTLPSFVLHSHPQIQRAPVECDIASYSHWSMSMSNRNDGHGNLNPVTTLGLHESNVDNTSDTSCNRLCESEGSDDRCNIQTGDLEAKASSSLDGDDESVTLSDFLNNTSETKVQDEMNWFLRRICDDQNDEPPKRRKIEAEEEVSAISPTENVDSVVQEDLKNTSGLFSNDSYEIRYCQVIEQNQERCTRYEEPLKKRNIEVKENVNANSFWESDDGVIQKDVESEFQLFLNHMGDIGDGPPNERNIQDEEEVNAISFSAKFDSFVQKDLTNEFEPFLNRMRDIGDGPPNRRKIQVEEEVNTISFLADNDSFVQKDLKIGFEPLLDYMGDNGYCQVIEQNHERRKRHIEKKNTHQPQTHKTCTCLGCANEARNGSVCAKHGAKVARKFCSREGCTNRVRNRGVCVKHGAKRPTCRHEGCTKYIVREGFCIRHSSKIKMCLYGGCTTMARNGRFCAKHGAKVSRLRFAATMGEIRRLDRGACAKHSAVLIRKHKADLAH